jgi:hypothetical protein
MDIQDYCELIIQCLIRYGGLEDAEARRLVDDSKICEVKNDVDRLTLFHEVAYYWAMWLLHGKDNKDWYLDPTLWPPPEEYYRWGAEWFRNKRRI